MYVRFFENIFLYKSAHYNFFILNFLPTHVTELRWKLF